MKIKRYTVLNYFQSLFETYIYIFIKLVFKPIFYTFNIVSRNIKFWKLQKAKDIYMEQVNCWRLWQFVAFKPISYSRACCFTGHVNTMRYVQRGQWPVCVVHLVRWFLNLGASEENRDALNNSNFISSVLKVA